MDFSIAINAWGIHTILPKALSDAEIRLWQTALREAADRCNGYGRGWSLIADVRGLNSADGAMFQPLIATVLLDIVKGALVERCALIAMDAWQADQVGRAAGGADPARKTRILAVEGRDRVQIAAAYNWALNGTQPQMAQNVPAGAVLRFPQAANRQRLSVTVASPAAIRRAS
ncbi:hypothetical protein J2847_006021 [Azospirillum agricola]|uniref:hypothetical protein n=1 Tax=Azospirillum agricola TaxID=1720247 RepID=UPI001AE7D5A3|nr:hypothetical protein [Azospirillum agricola]MBP2232690.1 hypothetical protein [Azospirillum agricola]